MSTQSVSETKASYDIKGLFGDEAEESNDKIVTVCGLKISILEKSGLALTLIADHIFSPALVLSELIYDGTIQVEDRRVLELGCGTGLVGLIASKFGASAVYLTDYDHESILCCPRLNLRQNEANLPHDKCVVIGHTWGSDASAILMHGKFQVLILADILWYTSSHADILQSIDQLLDEEGEVWISSGKYTTSANDFFDLAGDLWSHYDIPLADAWTISDVTGLTNLDERKQNCMCWRMQRRSRR